MTRTYLLSDSVLHNDGRDIWVTYTWTGQEDSCL